MEISLPKLADSIKSFALHLGFQQVGITGIELADDERYLFSWLDKGWHGQMHYMARHGEKRTRPAKLLPGTLRVVSVCMDYLPTNQAAMRDVLKEPNLGYISRYATNHQDYHKLIRKRLSQLVRQISLWVGPLGSRVFVDSAPVLEKALARKAGLGWIGKHTNLIHPKAGSWFFLGEIYINLPLPIDKPFTENYCGNCRACIDICPTKAIVAPYQLDARRCIAYLTIELKGSIPVEYRPLIGNRIYGCDDCQLVCPWNKFAKNTLEPKFAIREELATPNLISLFQWTEKEFEQRMRGTAIRRIGYLQWLRNIAVALGNAPYSTEVVDILKKQEEHFSPLVREHVKWALKRHSYA